MSNEQNTHLRASCLVSFLQLQPLAGLGEGLQRKQTQDLADVCQMQKSMVGTACADMEMASCPAAVLVLRLETQLP